MSSKNTIKGRSAIKAPISLTQGANVTDAKKDIFIYKWNRLPLTGMQVS